MFSVVIPLYNKEKYISRALQSVLRQTYKASEIIVVDDGSTDTGPDVVEKINDPGIRLVRQKNEGECAARNRGISLATHEYIAFLDADDAWGIDFLGTIADLIECYPAAGAYGTGYEIVDGRAAVRKARIHEVPDSEWKGILDYFHSAAYGDPPLSSSSVCIPHEVIRKVGGFPRDVPLGGDLDMWTRVALRYDIAYSSSSRAIYYQNATGRACNVCTNADLSTPVLGKLHSALKNSGFPESRALDIGEYIARISIGIAMINILGGKRKAGRAILSGIRTRHYRWAKIRWTMISFLSSRLYNFVVENKRSLFFRKSQDQ
jgi:glycosyltransferase involved in cell wall biosynthesis